MQVPQKRWPQLVSTGSRASLRKQIGHICRSDRRAERYGPFERDRPDRVAEDDDWDVEADDEDAGRVSNDAEDVGLYDMTDDDNVEDGIVSSDRQTVLVVDLRWRVS